MKKECCFCGKELDETEKIHKSDDTQPILWCDVCDKDDKYLNV